MKNKLKLLKSHTSTIYSILSKYKYYGNFPNTQGNNIKECKLKLIELEYMVDRIIQEDERTNTKQLEARNE